MPSLSVFVGMNVEHADQEEHHQQPRQGAANRSIDARQFGIGVRDQMEQCDPQHEPADAAHRQLHLPVRQRHKVWQPTSGQ